MSQNSKEGSRTARMVAAYRARYSSHDGNGSDGKKLKSKRTVDESFYDLNLFCDPFADWFAGDDGHQLATGYDSLFPSMELFICIRTIAIDQIVRNAVKNHNVTQVVVLGAGFDTRCARLRQSDDAIDLTSPLLCNCGVKFFEVDMPKSSESKLRLIEKIGAKYPRENASYVVCDFTKDKNVIDCLKEQSKTGKHVFDPSERTLFIMEGVTMYLSECDFRRTLKTISSSCPKSFIVFDLLVSEFKDDSQKQKQKQKENENEKEEKERQDEKSQLKKLNSKQEDTEVFAQKTKEFVKDVGEPFRFGTDDIMPILFDEGYYSTKSYRFDQLALNLTGTYDPKRAFYRAFIVLSSPMKFEYTNSKL